MVPGKDTEDDFGEVEVGKTDAIHATVDDVIYNLWGTKEPNYVIRMMATGGRLLAYETCKETVRIWKENGEDMVKKFKYKLPCDWNFRYPMRLMTKKSQACTAINCRYMGDRLLRVLGICLNFGHIRG